MVAGDVVLECPVFAGAMNEVAEIVGFSGSESRDPAGRAMFSPDLGIEPALGIKWSDEYVSYSRIAKGVSGLTREFESDLAKARWQARVQNRPGLWLVHDEGLSICRPNSPEVTSKGSDLYSRLFMNEIRSPI